MTIPTTLRSLGAMILVSTSGLLALAADDYQDEKVKLAEGVIVKVEPIDGSSERVKLTINTAAVWRDWARDQAKPRPKADNTKGENSVATKGEPISPTTSLVVEVGGKTQLANRFRSRTDDTNPGSKTVEQAERKEGSPQGQDVKTSPRDEKAPKLSAKDLKVGLFVEVDAKDGKANRLIVLLPVSTDAKPGSDKK